MKQISQNYKSGDIRLEDAKPPALKPGGVLVTGSLPEDAERVAAAAAEVPSVRLAAVGASTAAALEAGTARPVGIRKLRPYPALTETLSPRPPRLSTLSCHTLLQSSLRMPPVSPPSSTAGRTTRTTASFWLPIRRIGIRSCNEPGII